MSPTDQSANIPTKEYLLKHVPQDVPWNAARPVTAIIVGAGIAGIAAAILLQNKVNNLTYTVYEKLETVGGTWAENTYPGIRCDVPSHCYQLTFEPNPNWSEFYAKGSEIREYYEGVVKKHGVDKHLKLRTQVTKAVWSVSEQKWEVRVLDLATGQDDHVKVDFFISASGRLNGGVLPTIPGLKTFSGSICHSTNWDHEYDFTNKRVAIIGNGASGMQIIPSILDKIGHINHYARSKAWVSPFFRSGLPTAEMGTPGGHAFSEKEREIFVSDATAYLEYRKNLEITFYGELNGSVIGSPENESLRKLLIETMTERARGDKELLEKLIPDYAPGCKRLTPAPGYIEALLDPKVDLITEDIVEARPEGLVTTDGILREADAIIAATGFAADYRPHFPTVGLDDINLQELWSSDLPDTYYGVMAPGFPNYFFILQAQGTALNGVVPLQCEISAMYIAKCIRKIQSQSYTSLYPTLVATQEFNAVVDAFFEDKVSSDTCSSWMKAGKGNTRLLVSWPGSAYHRFDNMRDPRWEDFTFKRAPISQQNRFGYFGNGYTERERRFDADDLTKYLKTFGTVDLRTVHESWVD